MANVILDDTHLTNIANAIREKNGEATTYTPGDMAKAITDLPSGGVDDRAFMFNATNNDYLFAYGGLENLYNAYRDKISVYFYSGKNMFYSNSYIQTIDFPIKANTTTTGGSVYHMFDKSVVKSINDGCLIDKNGFLQDFGGMFYSAYYLRTLPNDLLDFFTTAPLYMDERNFSSLFYNCYSLRSISSDILATIMDVDTYTKAGCYQGFYYCCALDEIVGLGKPGWTGKGNMFNKAFVSCNRLKELQFVPGKVWEIGNMTIDLTVSVGYCNSTGWVNIINYNSDITQDTKITNDTTYQEFKNHPDSWTDNINYSRYNHDSAVNTINSLPDTSAYIAANSGTTNTIKFTGAAGALTDGGAINTLTEEEIAVATAKGWTVTLV